MSRDQRRYERIDIEIPCRLFIPEGGKQGGLRFEAFTMSSNLGLGGVFVASTFLLKPGVQLFVELDLPNQALVVQAQIAHTSELESSSTLVGMGVEFLDVDSAGRETLLRYFTPLRYQEFYGDLIDEFGHLSKEMPLESVSLIVNLWEEWKIKQEGGPAATASGAPPVPPKKRPRS
ncbi:MAG: PilZ domain-containing protein [Deltaproteobacteria bacterium]|nr:PilZ domain-containing protein [Deltaproteobacteria bacterium]